MTATLMPPVSIQFLDTTGVPLAYGLVYTAVAGTTAGPGQLSPKAAYTDSTENTQLPNPVVLDATGSASIWIDGFYSIAIYNTTGLLIRSADNVAINQITSIAVQESIYNSCLAGGTSDAITGNFTPPITATSLATGATRVLVRSSLPNATTTPTFTPNYGFTAAATIVKGNNVPLVIGDIAGAGHWLDLVWDSTLSVWVLMNPATNIDPPTFPATTATSAATDAITASYTPPITSTILSSGRARLLVRATAANATATPTFTPNTGGLSAAFIVKGENNPLTPGDIGGPGFWMDLQWDATLGKWVLLNPATGASPNLQIQSLSAAVSSNALTVTLNSPTTINFRNANLASGIPVSYTATSPLLITVPAGATLGTVSGVPATLALLLAYNGGAPVLCIVNVSAGPNLDETTLITPAGVISTGSNAPGAIYSASTVSANSPFRVVGYVVVTEPAAGTWYYAPSTVQGAGGNNIINNGKNPSVRAAVYTTTGAFTIPSNTTTNTLYKVTVVAAGGGGGGGGAGDAGAGSGGGGGGGAIGWFSGWIPGLVLNVTVGSGGIGGLAGGGGGGTGGSSSVTSGSQTIPAIFASGGGGGTGAMGGAGGAGAGGSLLLPGGDGDASTALTGTRGGGSFLAPGIFGYGSVGAGGGGQSEASFLNGFAGGNGIVTFEWIA